MIVNAFIVFQEFKNENPQKFDYLPVHFVQLEVKEYLVKSVLGHNMVILINTGWIYLHQTFLHYII
jgi:hypothetical protein